MRLKLGFHSSSYAQSLDIYILPPAETTCYKLLGGVVSGKIMGFNDHVPLNCTPLL